LIKDMAIVLRRLDYSETSLVLAVFTRDHGQQRLIAKGVKRSTKNRASIGIDLLERGRVTFSARPGKESTLSPLTEWRQDEHYPHLRGDLGRWYSAQYAAEVTAGMTEPGDPHADLFDALDGFLVSLDEPGPVASLISYLWKLLVEIGLRPEMERCTSCARRVETDEVVHFSSRSGGVVCRDCEPGVVEKRRVSRRVVQALRSAGPAPREDAAIEAFELLDYHFTELMHRPPRLSAPLRAAIGAAKGPASKAPRH
jgi:DNA repair protein RecO (recombination protein O)